MSEAALAQRPGTMRRAIGLRVGRLGWVGIGSAVVIVLLALMAIFAPLLAPQDPNAIDLLHPNAGSSSQHLLGTDDTGRDLLSRLIVGSRTSLLGPLLAVLLEVVVGVPIALAAAWNGGIVDGVISRVLDVLFAFPGILLAILVISLFGAGLRSWPWRWPTCPTSPASHAGRPSASAGFPTSRRSNCRGSRASASALATSRRICYL